MLALVQLDHDVLLRQELCREFVFLRLDQSGLALLVGNALLEPQQVLRQASVHGRDASCLALRFRKVVLLLTSPTRLGRVWAVSTALMLLNAGARTGKATLDVDVLDIPELPLAHRYRFSLKALTQEAPPPLLQLLRGYRIPQDIYLHCGIHLIPYIP